MAGSPRFGPFSAAPCYHLNATNELLVVVIIKPLLSPALFCPLLVCTEVFRNELRPIPNENQPSSSHKVERSCMTGTGTVSWAQHSPAQGERSVSHQYFVANRAEEKHVTELTCSRACCSCRLRHMANPVSCKFSGYGYLASWSHMLPEGTSLFASKLLRLFFFLKKLPVYIPR